MASNALKTFRTWIIERDDLTDEQKAEIFHRVGTMLRAAYDESSTLQEAHLRQHVTAHRNDNIASADAVAVADIMLAALDRIQDGYLDLAGDLSDAIDDVAGV